MKKIGFIGMGNMAQAMAVGLLRAGKVSDEALYAYATNQDKLRDNAARIGFNPCASAEEAAANAEIVIMACKPYQLEGVLGRLGGALSGKLVVSVAFGWNYERAKALLPADTRYQYIVPNTPVSICSGVLLVEDQNNLTGEEEALLEDLLGGLGLYMKLPFAQMGAANAMSGCGPAFMSMVLEALGDGGVKHGLTRTQAYTLAACGMEGTAKLQLETGLHPGVLKDQVCSPGGVTIRGVAALEENGLRNALLKAIDATFEK